MEAKKIAFTSGNIDITGEKITFYSNTKSLKKLQSMERYNMGHINSEEFSFLGILPIQIALRSLFLGVVTAIFAIIIGVEALSVLGVVMIGFGLITFNLDLWVDGLLGTKFAYKLCSYLFAGKGYKVIIQNNSGGEHIVFYVALNQLSEALKIESYKLKETPTTQTLGINDLEKISELFQKGILTEKEFNLKKKQILNVV